MAIIRLDCNLNGGDSVTPNNELFYRIYGDLDAYTVPIWTTGTALSDANVTVNNDNVIITGVDGATNTSFKIAAIDLAGNEGVLSDANSASIILFQDDFTGVTIDTGTWDVTNITSDVAFTQNNQLICTPAGVTDTGAAPASGIGSLAPFVKPATTYITFDITMDNSIGAAGCDFQVGIGKSSDPTVYADFLGITKSSTAGRVSFIHYRTGQATQVTPLTINLVAGQTMKIKSEETVDTLYYWDTSSWSFLGTVATPTGWAAEVGNNFYATIGQSDDTVNPDVMNIDNFVITDTDFVDQRP